MKIIGTLLIALGLLLGACGGGGESPGMPSPEPGKLPGHQVGSGGGDLDSLAEDAEDDEDVVEDGAPEDDGATEETSEDPAAPAE
jgi:hypothetical protein